jgi:hypothetical protein
LLAPVCAPQVLKPRESTGSFNTATGAGSLVLNTSDRAAQVQKVSPQLELSKSVLQTVMSEK